MRQQWQNQLSHPVAFVLSGGANLGAVQVGMLRALNGVAIAHHGWTMPLRCWKRSG